MAELLLSETHDPAGHRVRTWLEQCAHGSSVRIEQATHVDRLPLPEGAVERVMSRYARPVSEELEGLIGELARESGVPLGAGELVPFRFLPRYDVVAKDYLVWREPGQPSRAELAVQIAAALTHLARAFQEQRRS